MSYPIRRRLIVTSCFALSVLFVCAVPDLPALPATLKPAVTHSQLFTAVTPLADPAAGANDYFGFSVALSADGATALVGAPGVSSGSGKAYVFKRSGGVWSATPVASFSEPTSAANDEFGFSVALSPDGSTALVGTCCTTVTGHSGAGAVYVFTQTGGVWSATPVATLTEPSAANNDHFGVSIALANNVAIVGAPDTASSTGAAYIFTATGGVWSMTPASSLTGPAAADAFGTAVALSPDGSAALVGAPKSNSTAGAAYVFTQTGGVWSITPTVTLTDPGAGADKFGSSVAVSGSTVLVGAPNTSIVGAATAGEAYVYTQSGGIWPIVPTTVFTEAVAATGDEFGTSVALSADQGTALIGARSTNGGVTSKTYLYTQSGGAWFTTAVASFSEPDPLADANFTSSLALSTDGSTTMIGAPNVAYAVATSLTNLLALTLAAAPASVTVGQSITYSLTVTNDSASTATNVSLVNTLPSEVSFVSASAAGGDCNDSGVTVTCTLATLASQANWQPSIIVNATAEGSPSDTATVSADQTDPFTADNSASASSTVTAAAPPPGPPGGKSGGGGAMGYLILMVIAGLVARRRLRQRGQS